jgi:hypothetical protein
MSRELGDLVLKNCSAEEFKDEVDVVFSGLDSDVAQDTGGPRCHPIISVEIADRC